MPLENTTRWREEPVIPREYDIPSPVDFARKARGRIVEFRWFFSEDDLLRLRRAVFEWGSPVTGRYRLFDARVLAAINGAIGDANSLFALSEPRGRVDCTVSCMRGADFFRLQGHAPFDIIFGYGRAATSADPEVTARLGPSLREILASAVGQLGWDIHLLQEERFQPVRNILLGLRLDYGVEETTPAPGPLIDIPIHFQGPFSIMSEGPYPCLFTHEIARRNGVYLWTIAVEGEERFWYVGQTRRLRKADW